jgi:Family of unknown function (DUF6174)
MYMMKLPFRAAIVTVLLFLTLSECTSFSTTDLSAQPTYARVATQNVSDEYSKALNRWQQHGISSYEITVSAFSSVLAPPCSIKTTLIVQDNKLVATSDIETPVPVQMPTGAVIYNPECQDYERYLVTEQFKMVELLLADQSAYPWKVNFDPEYGYITELNATFGGESLIQFRFYGFQPK